MRLRRALVAALVLLAACTPGRVDRPQSEPSRTPEAPLRSGGVVDVGVLGEPLTLDPYSRRATELTWTLVRPVYPSLFRFRPDGSPFPDLAESIRSEGRGVVVTLADRKWSNGRPIDAHDVVASVRRAIPPSGFHGLSAKVVSSDEVRFEGRVVRWEQRLARVAFVLPGGKGRRRISGGPLRIRRRVPGLKIVYERTPGRNEVRIDGLRVFTFQDQGTLKAFVESGDMHVGLFPSTVNIEDRVDEGATLHRAVGWEAIWLDLRHSGLDRSARAGLAAAIDRQMLEESFVRADGRLAGTTAPRPGRGGAAGPFRGPDGGDMPAVVSLAAPEGDELLGSLRRAIQLRLAPATRAELVTPEPGVFYGRGDLFTAVRIVRSSGAPGYNPLRAAIKDYSVVPLFHVASFALSHRIEGVEVNPTFEGLLWNVERWGFPAGD